MGKKVFETGILNDRQIRFIEEYIITLNAAEAARRAGYSDKTARTIAEQNLNKPHIARELARRQNLIAEKMEVSKEQIIADLIAIKELCKDDPRNVNNSIKALEVISKMLGYFEVKKIDVTTNGESINQITWKEERTYEGPKDKTNETID